MKPLLYVLLFLGALCPALGQSLLNANFEETDTATSTGLKYWRSKAVLKTSGDEKIRHAGMSCIRLQTPIGEQFVSFSQVVALPQHELAQIQGDRLSKKGRCRAICRDLGKCFCW
ncbi:MAG: hypothetical protein IPO07_12200 [Haliscomenobacter sp.]|nr:hypothetical protein [Haliscomenobacter sp.]MBK9489457.1 hypothetical protein [Haliscomenobacter sp.]